MWTNYILARIFFTKERIYRKPIASVFGSHVLVDRPPIFGSVGTRSGFGVDYPGGDGGKGTDGATGTGDATAVFFGIQMLPQRVVTIKPAVAGRAVGVVGHVLFQRLVGQEFSST